MSKIYPFLLSAKVKALTPYLVCLLGIYCLAPNHPRNPTIVSSTDKFSDGLFIFLNLDIRESKIVTRLGKCA